MTAICAPAAPIPAALEGEHGGRGGLGDIEEQRPWWPAHGAQRQEDR
jgi:hypothetical protein